jgi:methylmalonyl-CoA mutase cobalamin-binding subunit
MAVRRSRRSVVVVADSHPGGDRRGRDLAASLGEVGVEATYLGRLPEARAIAEAASDRKADAIELCLGAPGAVVLLRQLLRELARIDRRDVSIVVHRAR